jgi:ABC-type phosphate transport system permease subunit
LGRSSDQRAERKLGALASALLLVLLLELILGWGSVALVLTVVVAIGLFLLLRYGGFGTWPDRRAERVLAALSSTVLVLIAGMVIFVFVHAWPSFSHNGLAWFGPGGNVDRQIENIYNSPAQPSHFVYTMHAWPLIYSTLLITVFAVVIALALAVFTAMFIVEFAPKWLKGLLDPVTRLLAAVPSVVYGLIGILVLVPFVGNHIVTQSQKKSVEYVVQLTGASLVVAIVILTIMITPIMIAIITDALRSVPSGWTEGALALGVNRFRVMWTIVVRSSRPAIVAAVVLASARALGEAIMLSMVSGSVAFAPNPLDGILFFLEPSRPLAATIVDNAQGLSVVPLARTLYAFAALLLIASISLSLAGWAAKRPMSRFGLPA